MTTPLLPRTVEFAAAQQAATFASIYGDSNSQAIKHQSGLASLNT